MNEKMLLFLNSDKPLPDLLRLAIHEKAKMLMLRKGEILQETGETCTRLFLIEKGVLCCYDIDADSGKEYCVWIMMEKDIVTCVRSYNKEELSTERIVALEDCLLWSISKQDMDELTWSFDLFSRIRQQFTDFYHVQSREMDAMRKRPPEVFYAYLKRTNEELTTRIPNRHLASFMGIRESTLYKIKQHKRNS